VANLEEGRAHLHGDGLGLRTAGHHTAVDIVPISMLLRE
jgi:hypothetical protein